MTNEKRVAKAWYLMIDDNLRLSTITITPVEELDELSKATLKHLLPVDYEVSEQASLLVRKNNTIHCCTLLRDINGCMVQTIIDIHPSRELAERKIKAVFDNLHNKACKEFETHDYEELLRERLAGHPDKLSLFDSLSDEERVAFINEYKQQEISRSKSLLATMLDVVQIKVL